MKGTCTLVASVLAAASTAALASRDVTSNPCTTSQGKFVNSKEKYAPRFDGLRFIETLVTAHR